MKALIFNSGIGKRMGELTRNNHKSLVPLKNGETIYERQLRILSENGIKEFVVTTGEYEDRFIEISNKYPNIHVQYVNNPKYAETNYIYSFYLAKEYIDDDFLMLHGDLVFNRSLVDGIINCPSESCVTVDKTKNLPEKDFKGRICDGKLLEVSINIFDEDCYSLQPFYKLSQRDISLWMNKVTEYVEQNNTVTVYAENALNDISNDLHILGYDASNDYVEEIDNQDDYNRVSNQICYYDYREQVICNGIDKLYELCNQYGFKKPYVVATNSMINQVDADYVRFSNFSKNPTYEDVVKSVELYKANNCDGIISIGGGSAIDVAKATKAFSSLNADEDYLSQPYKYNNVKHIAIPTTAGTGSESTSFAVIYKNGEKLSISNPGLFPDAVIFESSFLKTVPYIHKVSCMLDALCQSIESLWAIGCTEESIGYAKQSIELIIANMDEYIAGSDYANEQMLKAANLSGRAINISRTTLAHAMSYKLTSLYNIPHGQAVANCMVAVFDLMENQIARVDHPLGRAYIDDVMSYLKVVVSVSNLSDWISKLLAKYDMGINISVSDEELDMICRHINLERLNNFPVKLSCEDISNLYKFVLE